MGRPHSHILLASSISPSPSTKSLAQSFPGHPRTTYIYTLKKKHPHDDTIERRRSPDAEKSNLHRHGTGVGNVHMPATGSFDRVRTGTHRTHKHHGAQIDSFGGRGRRRSSSRAVSTQRRRQIWLWRARGPRSWRETQRRQTRSCVRARALRCDGCRTPKSAVRICTASSMHTPTRTQPRCQKHPPATFEIAQNRAFSLVFSSTSSKHFGNAGPISPTQRNSGNVVCKASGPRERREFARFVGAIYRHLETRFYPRQRAPPVRCADIRLSIQLEKR